MTLCMAALQLMQAALKPDRLAQTPMKPQDVWAPADVARAVAVNRAPSSARQLTQDRLRDAVQLALTLIPTLIFPDDAAKFRRFLLNIDVHLNLALCHLGFHVEQVALERLIYPHDAQVALRQKGIHLGAEFTVAVELSLSTPIFRRLGRARIGRLEALTRSGRKSLSDDGVMNRRPAGT